MFSLSYQSAVYHFSIVFELGNNSFHTLTNHRIHFVSIAISYSWMILNKKFCDDNLERSTEEWKKEKNKAQRAMSLFLFCVLLSTVAWETASPIALRDCSKEVRGEASIYVILAGESMQSSLHLHKRPLPFSQISVISFRTFSSMGRYKNLGSYKFLLKYI